MHRYMAKVRFRKVPVAFSVRAEAFFPLTFHAQQVQDKAAAGSSRLPSGYLPMYLFQRVLVNTFP
jgi:hypothetical protein